LAAVLTIVAIVAVVAIVAMRDVSPSSSSAAASTVASVPATSTAPTTVAPATTGAVTTTTATAPASSIPGNAGGDFVAVAPMRLIDTRTGVGTGGRSGKTSSVGTSIVGLTGTVPAGQVKAVALNVTIAEATQPGYLTVSAAGSRPLDVSQIAFVNATASSLIVTRANPEGLVDLRLSDGASSHLIVDLLGYFVTDRSPQSLSIIPEAQPVALADSRGGAAIGPGANLDLTLPAPQSGAIVGITATGAQGPGYLTVYGGAKRPDTSAVNFAPGHDATAVSIVATGADRAVHIFNGSSASVHIVVFQIARLVAGAPAEGLALNIEGTTAQDGRSAPFPFRTVDTRGTSTCPTTLGGGVSSIASIFPKAKALLVSVTVVNPSVSSYLTAYTGTAQPPSVATLNYDAGEVRSNIALIPVSGDRVTIVCGAGNPEYILDVLATLE
jgi:urease beta subunit